jgi:PAS domain S-box-containing protein
MPQPDVPVELRQLRRKLIRLRTLGNAWLYRQRELTRQQERLYRHAVENSLGLMCAHDLNGILLWINPAAAKSLGFHAGEGVGRSLADYLSPAVAPRFKAYLERVRRDSADTGFLRLVAGDGSERVWLYRNVLYEESGAPPKVLGHAQDVTTLVRARITLRQSRERYRQLAEELEQTRRELASRVEERTADLREANQRLKEEMERRNRLEEELLRARNFESLSSLAGSIAHELNNITTIVAGNIELARMALAEGASAEDSLANALHGCERVAALTHQWNAFTMGGAPVRRSVPVRDLVAAPASSALSGYEVRLELQVDPETPPADADPAQIAQAIRHVVRNAVESTPPGGTVEVTVGPESLEDGATPLAAGRYVRITVRDRGRGIAPENLGRIFDPYFSTKGPGRGIGLTAAYAIVSRHGGLIQAESAPGEGTRILIRIPAAARIPGTPHTVPLASGLRILVMDDEEAIRRLAIQMLGRLGYRVDTAPEGGEAVAMYSAALGSGNPYAAVILDLTVPCGIGGLETVGLLHVIDPQARVLVSSGYSSDPVMASYADYGFAAVLPKPWNLARLVEALSAATTQRC